MSEFSAWAEKQLDQAGYLPTAGQDAQVTRTSVLRVCREFGEINFAATGPGVEKRIVALLTELLNHRALPVAEDPFRWVPARQLPPSVGSPVRIKLDAFVGDKGTYLNGRTAVVGGARRGEFIIQFVDGQQPDSARVLAADMETRVG